MFGIKIISEERYLDEQNAKLRSINAKRKEENENLAEKNRKLKEQVKEKKDIKFEKYFTLCTPEHCDTCTHEQKDCKKFYLERKTDVICVCTKPSFRKK